jgi:predicted nucleotide-binding protein
MLNMANSTKIFNLVDKLSEIAEKLPSEELEKLEEAACDIGKAWSGSWLGYQSRVYYKNLSPVPAGAHFSIADGLYKSHISETSGNWVEYTSESLINHILKKGNISDLQPFVDNAKEVNEIFEDIQSDLLSLLTPVTIRYEKDTFIQDLTEKIKKEKITSRSTYLQVLRPTGHYSSGDYNAIQGGVQTPPHFSVIADVLQIKGVYKSCATLGKYARRMASYLESQASKEDYSKRIGTRVFIGHGRSHVWKNLKDFIQDRLHLPWDEFNRIPVAGQTNITRLSTMLDNAAIAFIVMTAEDEQADQKLHARMNVIHEAGLFQGRLGFEKAILLLEEGCEEFSNVQGLGQIRFPKGKIETKFEDIRQVLERENLIE